MISVRFPPTLHRGDALVPAPNHLPGRDLEFERLAAIQRAVELLALGAVLVEPACIVHDANLARLGLWARANGGVLDLQA